VIGGGFAQIEGDRVKVLAEFAINEAQIDENAAEKAMQRAGRRSRATRAGSAEVERLEAVVRFSVAQLSVKRRRR